MVDNPYAADDHKRLLNHAVNITHERGRYTTSTTIEFHQKSDQTSITPAKLRRELFAEMLMIDPTTKMIANDGKVYTHSKELPIGTEYANTLTEATVNNKKFNTVKAYICCKIETDLYYKKFMYNNYGAKTILLFLRHNNMWLKWNKFSTHREVSIDFIKYVNTSITLQKSIRSRIELVLYNMPLTDEDKNSFTLN